MLNTLNIRDGTPDNLGLTWQGNDANFAVFSKNAARVFLGLFAEGEQREIPLHRTQDIWHIAVVGLPEGVTYAFRCEGPYDEGKGLLFKSDRWLVDPYAKRAGLKTPVEKPKSFDWQGTRPLQIARENLIIYEMHVRGFTQHSSSGVQHPGTFLGIIEKIPYLKALGVNAVELVPVFAFHKTTPNLHPKTEQHLENYWGYQTLHFFAPEPLYGVQDPIAEFKAMVKALHQNGIAVILDIVVNHSGEGSDKNFYVHFRGLDNSTYYLIDAQGNYLNFTGCGNTLNCNEQPVQRLILDCLRYWIEEMHVDGFRFDSAAILTRDGKGTPMAEPPLIKAMQADPIIQKALLIAEPWDAAGSVQLGAFSKWGPWAEWNSYFRDAARRFIKGTDGQVPLFANAFAGSKALFKTPLSTVNFITAHDGFCLRDLVSYDQKHNDDNGENNRDGSNQNESWNCGAEGPTEDKNILELRERQMRNFFLALFMAQGIPMLQMGDEYGHTRHGNNNPYVQDNEVNWFLWEQLKTREKQWRFVSALIAFRESHKQLRHADFLTTWEIEWHGTTPAQPDWGHHTRFIALAFKESPSLYLAFNASFQPLKVTLPPNKQWRQVVNTAEDWQIDPKGGASLNGTVELIPYSTLLVVS